MCYVGFVPEINRLFVRLIVRK